MEYVANSILNLKQIHADLFCILLANLAKNDEITSVFQFQKPSESDSIFKSSRTIDCLIDCFVKGSDRSLNKYADFDYLAYFFADLSRFKEGRVYFVTEQAYDSIVPLTKLLVFTEHESKIRRQGVASTIKNALFDLDFHEKVVRDENINLLPYLLLPLSGPEQIDEDELFNLPEELQFLPADKKRDPVTQILATHVESLLLLSTTRPVREYLREKSVYSIIRELHKAVDDEDVMDQSDRLVQVLMRDEMPEENEDEDDDEIVEVL